MPLEFKLTRKCSKCDKEKDIKAFIGVRPMCRVCWYYMSPKERKDYIVYVGDKNGKGRSK